MEYEEAKQRLEQLRQLLGSGIKGEAYKQALAEYTQLKAAMRGAQPQSGGGGGNESSGGGGEWWENRGSGGWSML